jgi:RHS repeat-associated protein
MLDRILPEATNPPVGKTNLIKFGTRYYMPEISRWTQPDPVTTIADPMTLDRYLYVQDNPTTFTDPSGRLFPSEPGEQQDIQTPIGGDEYPDADDGGDSVMSSGVWSGYTSATPSPSPSAVTTAPDADNSVECAVVGGFGAAAGIVGLAAVFFPLTSPVAIALTVGGVGVGGMSIVSLNNMGCFSG